jgi:cell fate (sporulation/competence/biofilm development) regulator YlbF (YheA/YmcA/DUF963 family)
MPVETQTIIEAADKVGQLVSQHPAVEKYRQAQKSLSEDGEAARMLNDFNRQLMNFARQEEAGMPVTDAQRHNLENLQTQLASHLKVKALNLAQVEFYDLLRKVSEAIRGKINEGPAAAPGAAPAAAPGGGGDGPRLVM